MSESETIQTIFRTKIGESPFLKKHQFMGAEVESKQKKIMNHTSKIRSLEESKTERYFTYAQQRVLRLHGKLYL